MRVCVCCYNRKHEVPPMRPPDSIVPYQEDEANQIVYAEMNLEKWPIWEPMSSPKTMRPRIFERERLLPDGSRSTGKVEVGFTQHGNLSTRDQKVYYILLKLWDNIERPETPVNFSLQKIARLLGEDWSRHTHRSIARSLLQLRGILFVWENSYFDKATGEHLELLDTFNILSELTIARRTKKLHATTEACVFQFHRQLLASLHANHTTPLFLDTLLGLKSEIAQLLYPRLDLFLANKSHYERRTKELFEDLGLRGETYRHRSARKRVIERALRELQGAPLTTGRIALATVEPTKDDLDFKIVIHKGSLRKPGRPRKVLGEASEPIPRRSKALPPKDTSATPKAPTPKTSAVPDSPDPATLALYFHQVFHGASLPQSPSPKDLAQAKRLLEAHGLPKARTLIDFSRDEATKTKYAPASLSGILQYEARFEASWQAQERARSQQQERVGLQRQAREAQEKRQSEIAGELMARVALVKKRLPEAFAAFIEHVEAEQALFLETPIARRARPETRELLAREYNRPARRVEMFVEFFQAGAEGEPLLCADPQAREVAAWLRAHKDLALPIIRSDDGPADAGGLLN